MGTCGQRGQTDCQARGPPERARLLVGPNYEQADCPATTVASIDARVKGRRGGTPEEPASWSSSYNHLPFQHASSVPKLGLFGAAAQGSSSPDPVEGSSLLKRPDTRRCP